MSHEPEISELPVDLNNLSISELRELSKQLQKQNRELHNELDRLKPAGLYREAMGNISEAIVIYDEFGHLVTCNNNFLELYGYSPSEAYVGVHYIELGKIDLLKGNVAVGDEFGDGEEYLKRKKEYRKELSGSFIVKLKDGRWIKTTDRPMKGGGFVSVQVDISDVKALEEEMSRLARYDSLTTLANRRFFVEKSREFIADALRNDFQLAVIFIDLDRFKTVNDEYGHNTGDKLLIEVAHRLKRRLRRSDIIARFGGDEFVILLSDKETASGAAEVAGSLIKELSKPFRIENFTISIGASIGIAFMSPKLESLDEMVIAADKALYAAKKAGRGQWVKYNEFDHSKRK